MLVLNKRNLEYQKTYPGFINLPLIVVEDDIDFHFAIKSILKKAGFETRFFTNGTEAVKEIGNDTNALLIIDYNLQDMTGKDLVNHLRKKSIDLPFIIMTGMGSKTVAVEMMKMGAMDYIEKDITFQQVLPRVILSAKEKIEAQERIKESEKALRASEEKYRLLAESTSDLIFILDLNGSFTYYNKAVMKLCGINPMETRKLSMNELVPPMHRNKLLSCMNDSYAGFKSEHNCEIEIYDKDRNRIPVEMSTSPIIKNGKLHSIHLSLRDISLRKQTEEKLIQSERKSRSVIDNATDGIFILDEPGNCIDINPAGCRLLGYTKDEALEKNVRDFIPEEDYESFEKEYKKLSLEGDYIAERRAKRKDGTIIQVEISTRVMTDGTTIGLVRDVSERKKAEKLIRKMNRKLENMVSERTEQLEKTLAELTKEIDSRIKAEKELIKAKNEVTKALEKEKNLSELKSRFLNMISHEYRTPLTVINTSAYLLSKNFENTGHLEFKPHIEKINLSVKAMTRLFEDVIIIDKIDSGKYDKRVHRIDLVLLVKQIIDNLKYREGENAEIILETNKKQIEINTNSNLISMVINNLVSNSIKYNPENNPIYLGINYNEGTLIIEVSDEGIGIDKKDLALLFDPFHRGDNTGLVSGAGLGLTIVKKAVSILEGRINVESEPGKGTTVSVLLPDVQ